MSSQFFTGLLFALPLLDAPSAVLSSTEIESREYITMTMEAMRQAGISVAEKPGLRGFEVLPAAYCPFAGAVEADWSQAAFWYAANFLGSPVEIQGLNPLSAQGDLAVASLYWRLARPGDREIDVSGCPDLLPPLAVMAAVRQGTVRFVHAARLRLKESDRLQTTAAMLQALGGTVEEGADSLTVQGQPQLLGGTVDGANDHRIVMAAAVAATACAIGVNIDGLPAGESIDLQELDAFLDRRKPGKSPLSTTRKESDAPIFLSGLEHGVTCGAPLCAIIENSDQHSSDYQELQDKPRPGHADYTAYIKWDGHADMRGGGHFSGRLTAPLCIAGGIAKQILSRHGVHVGAHLASVGDVEDLPFPLRPNRSLFDAVAAKPFPVLDDAVGERMQALILEARQHLDCGGARRAGRAHV